MIRWRRSPLLRFEVPMQLPLSAPALVRFYFVGGADTTMIINPPGGSYVCVDDSFGTINPTLDFNSPASGRYDARIATFAEGASVGGTPP
jgi:hypothetical protein